MRRLFLILVTTATGIVLYAQEYAPLKYDTQAELEADIWKSGGELYVTDFPVPSSDAPKGYRPFYISMFNRHGARFAHNENIYGTLRKVLSDAHEAEQLTETGERLYRQYNSFYPKVAFPRRWANPERPGAVEENRRPSLFSIPGSIQRKNIGHSRLHKRAKGSAEHVLFSGRDPHAG
jgi:hypothetical protein